MSTEDERREAPAPRTRAELRAAREAAARAEAAAAETPAVEAPAAETPAAEAPVAETPASEAPVAETLGPPQAASAAPTPDREAVPAVPLAPEPVFAAATPPSLPEDARGPGAVGWRPAEASDTDTTSGRLPPGPDARRDAPGSKERDGGSDAGSSDPGRRRRFLLTLGAVLGVLVLVGTGLGIVSLLQGPRLTDVQVAPAEAIEASGSRVILTANQSLSAIDADQVTVEPAVPFTIDAAGRGVGVRFTVPLDDSTTYTVSVAGVTGASGGPSADLTTTFTTPASNIFLLRRDASGDDTIFRTDLSGEKAVPVFTHDRINDFRATSTQLVVSVEEDGVSRLLVMDRDGANERELPLPGEGTVGAIQVSDRGGFVGYSYSDRKLSDTEGRASVLVTQSLTGDDEPQIVEVNGEQASVFVWQFVPDSSAVLFIDFDGALSLLDRSTDAGVQSLGLAATIQGITRGTYTAIVERLDGTVVELNLADGSEQPLAASDPDYGTATTITPFPGGTLRHVVARDDAGLPIGQAVIRVDDDGAATPLVEVGATDSILQACASPSGQYAAVVIAPDLADNPYDGMLLPLPENVETHLIDMESGDEIVALTGFDASWCQTAPRF